nr:tetratricopeptide repeat protein [Alphaproteobacteria bacterium]
DNNIKTSWVWADLGILNKDLGNYEQAKNLLKKSLTIHENIYEKSHIKTARILMNIGHVYLLERNKEVAKTFLQKALFIFQEHGHPTLHECVGYLRQCD